MGSSGTVTTEPVNDGIWHNITIATDPNTVTLQRDESTNSQATRMQDSTIVDVLRDSSNVFVGGVPPSYFSASSSLFSGEISFYKGCMDEVRVGGVLLPFFGETQQGSTGAGEQFKATPRDVTAGCFSDDVCGSSECQNEATCLDEWNQYSCQCLQGELKLIDGSTEVKLSFGIILK